jgi:hypothetical protein
MPADQSACGNVRFEGVGRPDRMAEMGATPTRKWPAIGSRPIIATKPGQRLDSGASIRITAHE